jgi:hypothetical protein
MTPLGLPPKTMPNLNTFRILSLVWKRKEISRIEVAADLGLTKSTVTKITSQLMADGLLTEGPAAKAEGRGRPRVALALNASRGLVLGLEVRTDGWSSVLVRFDGTVARRDAARRSWHSQNFTADLADLISQLTQGSPGGIPILGVGIGLPGIVDARSGILVRSNPLDLQHPLALQADLEARIGLPVVLENDANCGCWGELAFGPAPEPGPFLFVLCEDRRHRVDGRESDRVAAVGFGLVLGGKPWWGPDHSSGEFSSVLKSGTQGRSFQFDLPDDLMGRVFSDPAAEAALVEELGRNVAMLVNFLNLKAVRVAWPASGNPAGVLTAFRRLIAANWIYPTAVDCQVSVPTGGADAVAWGAAGWFLEDLLGDTSFDEAQPRWK